MKLATSEQMRQIDKLAIDNHHIQSIDLMELAARCVVDELSIRFPRAKSFAVCCGPGNNGGDGLAIARLLAKERGWTGAAWLVQTNESKTSDDHKTNLLNAQEAGISVRLASGKEFVDSISKSAVVIDAILGTGSLGPPRDYVLNAIKAINEYAAGTVVAVDIPSGVDADSGMVPADAVKADITITLGFSKVGLHLQPARNYVGELIVCDDFLPDSLIDEQKRDLKSMLTEPGDVASWLPSREPARDSNKGTYGAVMILAGSSGFAGAASLASLGAARSGAGTVTLGVPEGIFNVAMSRVPAVVMTQGFADTGAHQFRKSAVDNVLAAVAKKKAVGIGPGIGHENDEIRGFVLDFVRRCDRPLVIDADALTIIAAAGDSGVDAVKSRKASTILTPHPGEMARLLGCETTDVQNDRLNAVKKASENFGCIVLLKGDRTLIATPDGRLAINVTGNPGMASGGMGDVLTGIATTFLGQMEDPFHAAAAAAYLHGVAGDIACDEIGVAGFLATDVAERLPQAITRCLREPQIDG